MEARRAEPQSVDRAKVSRLMSFFLGVKRRKRKRGLHRLRCSLGEIAVEKREEWDARFVCDAGGLPAT